MHIQFSCVAPHVARFRRAPVRRRHTMSDGSTPYTDTPNRTPCESELFSAVPARVSQHPL